MKDDLSIAERTIRNQSGARIMALFATGVTNAIPCCRSEVRQSLSIPLFGVKVDFPL